MWPKTQRQTKIQLFFIKGHIFIIIIIVIIMCQSSVQIHILVTEYDIFKQSKYSDQPIIGLNPESSDLTKLFLERPNKLTVNPVT
jgi:hypothetical protein